MCEIEIRVETKMDTQEWAFGETFLNALVEFDPRLLPQRMTSGVSKWYPVEKVDDCQLFWPHYLRAVDPDTKKTISETLSSFDWKNRSRLNSRGSVVHLAPHRTGTLRDWGGLHINIDAKPGIDYQGLFRLFCEIVPAEFGYMHIFSEDEPEFGPWDAVRDDYIRQFPQQHVIQTEKFPNLLWSMAFGPEFQDGVDWDRVAAGGVKVERVGQSTVTQLTDSIFDIIDDHPTFSAKRAAAKALFPPDYFLIADEPPWPDQP